MYGGLILNQLVGVVLGAMFTRRDLEDERETE